MSAKKCYLRVRGKNAIKCVFHVQARYERFKLTYKFRVKGLFAFYNLLLSRNLLLNSINMNYLQSMNNESVEKKHRSEF